MQPSHLVSVVVGIAVLGLLEPGSVRSQMPLQVVEDGTLGTQVTVRGRTFVIDNGTTVGSNLFHSFQQFSVPAGGRASFQNALSIRNILVRVTGGMRSEIQGTIQTRGSANLFLMNPSGILFGENAQLQIGGSFVGTTASAILFPNGAQFSLNSSVAPENELLRVNPSALLVNQLSGQTPGIQTAGSYLSVPTGQSLLLIGGNVQFGSGSAFNSELVVRGGRLEIAALSDGLVGVEMDSANRPRLNISHPVAGAAVRINEGTVFNIGGSSTNSAHRSGGYLQIYGASITANGSNNSPIALNARGAEQGRGGIVSLHATENLALRNTGINVDSNQMGEGAGSIAIAAGNAVLLSGGGTSLSSQTYGSGVGGNIAIRGRTIRLTDQASILTNTFGSGDAGTVSFRADGTIDLEGASGLSTVSVLGATGKGGAVDIRSGSLRLTDQSFISTSTASAGAAGNVDIHTGTFELTGGSRIVTTTSGEGDAGRVRIDTGPQGRVSILDSRLVSSTGDGSGGRGGDIQLETGNLFLTDGVLSASTAGTQRAGNIHIRASHSVQVTGLAPNFSGAVAGFLAPGIFTSTIAPGPAGILSIHTEQLSVQGGARISSSTASPFTTGTGGIVSVHADSVELAGIARDGRSPSGLFTETQAAGDAGSLTINAPRLLIRDGAQVSASTSGTGRPGSILVQNGDSVSLTSGAISTAINPGATVRAGEGEPAGNITIQTRTLSLNNHARISASTSGEGDAGNIRIQATDATSLTNSGISTAVNPGAIGRGGNIDIQTGVFSLADNAQVTASTAGQGNAGSVRVTATTFESSGGGQIRTSTSGGSNAGSINLYILDSITLAGNPTGIPGGLFATTTGAGSGGNLVVNTNRLRVQDGAEISAFTSGTGTPGKIEVNSGESIALSNGLISTAVNPGAVISRGEGKESGNISLQTRRLSLMDSAQISASTSGEGDAGNIRIQATDATSLTNSGISTAVNPGAIGRGGNIDIQTGVFSLADNAQVTASTAGQGNAGSVRVTATTFESSGGGQIRTSTAGGSNAGSINLYILDSVTLTGNRSGLFASTDRGSSGNGGSIFIDPRIVTVRDGARIAVDSQGSGTGGSIDLQAGRLVLDRGEISAQTASNQGGNINLQLSDLLLLRRNSQISTTAGTAQTGGDGGNIRIMAPFIIALRTENNDITANAFTGRGGRVDITTQGLFGIEPRDRLTPLSDITASSEFGIAGVVTINTPDVDPSRGLTELPSNLVDAASQIAQGCVPDTRQSTSSFVVTGRGGLPPSPTEPLGNDAVMTAWVTVDGKQEVGNRGQGTGDRGQGIEDRGQGIEDRGQRTEDKGQRRQRRTGNRGQGAGAGTPDPRYPVVNPPSSPSAIIEAQSWIVDANGQIVLVAPSSTRNSHSWLVNGACRTHPGD